MKKNKKWLVIAGVVLLIILGLRLVNLSSFKGKIETEASRASGLAVTIGDDIHLGMAGFRPSIVVRDVHAVGSNGRTDIKASRVNVAVPLSLKPKKILVHIDDLILNGRLFGNYKLPLNLAADGVEISNFSGTLEKADIKGNFSYHYDKMTADLDVKNLDYAVFAKGMTGGDANVKASITSRGGNADSLMRNLDGTALLSGGKGHLAGNAVNLWAGNLMTTVMQGNKTETDIECVVTDFDIKNGVAQSKAIIVDTDKVAIFGKGSVNLVGESMNLRFTPKPKESAFVNLALPVTVVGTFANPRVQPDPEEMFKKIGGFVLGAINPALGILPMFESGNNINAPCDAYLKAKGSQP